MKPNDLSIKLYLFRHVAICLLLSIGIHSGVVFAQHPSLQIMGMAKAKSIALKRYPGGEIDEVELERVDGQLIYDIEIETADKDMKLILDAYTGEVLHEEDDDDGLFSDWFK
jgi:hypothetical protein